MKKFLRKIVKALRNSIFGRSSADVYSLKGNYILESIGSKTKSLLIVLSHPEENPTKP